jgi:hypothetical protein
MTGKIAKQFSDLGRMAAIDRKPEEGTQLTLRERATDGTKSAFPLPVKIVDGVESEQLSMVADERSRSGGDGRDEFVAVDPTPAGLGGVEELVGHGEAGLAWAGAASDLGA